MLKTIARKPVSRRKARVPRAAKPHARRAAVLRREEARAVAPESRHIGDEAALQAGMRATEDDAENEAVAIDGF